MRTDVASNRDRSRCFVSQLSRTEYTDAQLLSQGHYPGVSCPDLLYSFSGRNLTHGRCSGADDRWGNGYGNRSKKADV